MADEVHGLVSSGDAALGATGPELRTMPLAARTRSLDPRDADIDSGSAKLVYAVAEISLRDRHQGKASPALEAAAAAAAAAAAVEAQPAPTGGAGDVALPPYTEATATEPLDAASTDIGSAAAAAAPEAVDGADGGDAGEGLALAAPEHRPAATAPKLQICFDFTKGTCTRGDKCKYTHDLATIVQFNSKEKGICFDYLRNQCQRGLLCRFSHDLSNIAQQCQVNGTSTKGRTNAICYDFVKGVCQRGSECRYSHDLSLIARTARGGGNHLRSGEVCYDYLRGRCTRGPSCKYLHNVTFLGGCEYLVGSEGGYLPVGCAHTSMGGAMGQPGLMGAICGGHAGDAIARKRSVDLPDGLRSVASDQQSEMWPGMGGAPHMHSYGQLSAAAAAAQHQHHQQQQQQGYASLAGYGAYAHTLQHAAAASMAQMAGGHPHGLSHNVHEHHSTIAQQMATRAAMADQAQGNGAASMYGGGGPQLMRTHSVPGAAGFLGRDAPAGGGIPSNSAGSGSLMLPDSFNAILANLGGHTKGPVALAEALKSFASMSGSGSLSGTVSTSVSGTAMSASMSGGGSLGGANMSMTSVGGSGTHGGSACGGGGGRPPVAPSSAGGAAASGGGSMHHAMHHRLSDGGPLAMAPGGSMLPPSSAPQTIPASARAGSDAGGGAGSDAGSLPEPFSLPGNQGGVGGQLPAADPSQLSRTAPSNMADINPANLPPDLMPLLKEIWNKP